MGRKRVDTPRRYCHQCPAHGNREQQIDSEICPECGQRGEFRGFFQGMYSRMGQKSRLLGFPCSGAHMTFLPDMTQSCQRCEGEGIVLGDDFDYECPACHGLGGFLIRTEEEMRKIRRWALLRHQLEVEERKNPIKPDNRKINPVPENPIHSRDPISFAKGFMAIVNYHKKYAERNSQIGELILPCDDHGWDIFMEMIEIWNNTGGGLDVSQEAILLKRSLRKNAVTLLSIYPPVDQLPQRLLVNRRKIKEMAGLETERMLWERIANLNPTKQEWIYISEGFTKVDARDWVLNLARIAKQSPF